MRGIDGNDGRLHDCIGRCDALGFFSPETIAAHPLQRNVDNSQHRLIARHSE